VLYPVALAVTFGGFLVALATKSPADITILRGLGEPYVIEADGRVANQIRVKIANRTAEPRSYTIGVDDIGDGKLVAPENPLAVAPGRTESAALFVMLPQAAFHDGERRVTFTVTDGAGYRKAIPYRLVGPEREEHEQDRGHP
jgi:polyferredoxin